MKQYVVFALVLFATGLAYASPYEWITGFEVSALGVGCDDFYNRETNTFFVSKSDGCSYYTSVNVSGSGNYLENVGVYKKMGGGSWSFVKSNSYHATYGWDTKTQMEISDSGNYGFENMINMSALVTGIYTFRASINYNGCGSWTPTPNLASCGDTRDINVSVSN